MASSGVRPGSGGEGVRAGAGGSGVLGSTGQLVAATGGDAVTFIDGWWYHFFWNDGTFSPGGTLEVESFVIGGGAGSTGGVNGTNVGAGAASGIVRTYNGPVTANTSVTVGDGGVKSSTNPTNGETSSFGVYAVATGGAAVSNASRTGGSNADFSGGTNADGTNAGGGAGAGSGGSGSSSGNGVEWPPASGLYWGGGGGSSGGSVGTGGSAFTTATEFVDQAAGIGAGGTTWASGNGGKNGSSGAVVVRHQGDAVSTGDAYGFPSLFHLDASTLELSNGDLVTSWPDVSGLGNDFGSSVIPGISPPLYVSDSGGSIPAVDFTSTIRGLDGDPAMATGLTSLEVLMVMKATAQPAVNYARSGPPLFWGSTGSGNWHYPYTSGTTIYTGIAWNSRPGFNAPGLSSPHLMTSRASAGLRGFLINGVSMSSSTSNTMTFTHGPFLGYGGYNSTTNTPSILGPGNGFDGIMMEAIGIPTILSERARRMISVAMKLRYGLTVAGA